MSELDQFLNDLLLDNNVFSSVIGLMKNKLKKEAQIEKEKAAEKAKKAAEEAIKAAQEAEEDDDPICGNLFYQ